MANGPNTKIFINYRRGDDPGFTHALYQRLEGEFSPERLFMDVEGHIKPGDDFVEVLGRWVAACDVLLVIIGPRWQNLLAARKVDPADFVVIEIKAALDQGKRVIPVLVGGASFPSEDFIPEAIKALARKQAIGLRPDRFRADCEGLIAALKEISAAPERARHAPIRDALIEAAQNARIKAAEAAAERVRNSEKAAEVAERLRNLENEHAKAVETERNLADEEARLEKELQNRVEAFVHDAEKTLRELSDKVSNADRKAMEAALSEFKADPRSAAKGHDLVKVFDAARLRRK